MVEDTTQLDAEPRAPSVRPRPAPMAMCPMATMCRGMIDKPPSGFLLTLPGVLLIAVGVLIFIEPAILVWLVAAVFILMGIMMFMMANFVRRMGVQLRNV